jgi:hypothetical protein
VSGALRRSAKRKTPAVPYGLYVHAVSKHAS